MSANSRVEQLLLPARQADNHRHEHFLPAAVLVERLHHAVKHHAFMHRLLVNQHQIVRIFHQNIAVKQRADNAHVRLFIRQNRHAV